MCPTQMSSDRLRANAATLRVRGADIPPIAPPAIAGHLGGFGDVGAFREVIEEMLLPMAGEGFFLALLYVCWNLDLATALSGHA